MKKITVAVFDGQWNLVGRQHLVASENVDHPSYAEHRALLCRQVAIAVATWRPRARCRPPTGTPASPRAT